MITSDVRLTITSLITALLVLVHIADDVVRGMAPGNLTTLAVMVVVVTVWLYGTFVLAGRVSGYVIMICGSLLGLLMPVLHLKGAGIGAALAQSSGGLFFVWTLLAVGASGAFMLVLCVRGLRGASRPA